MKTKTAKEKNILQATKRDIFGKANRAMRKTGLIPANINGNDFKPLAISIKLSEFIPLYKKTGETEVVYIKIDDTEVPTLISELQIHPLTQFILHVDLRKVNLKQKVEAQVPLLIMGKSEAVDKKNGVLLTQMEDVTVEALPTDIPHEISVDISVLTELGQGIKIADLPKNASYEIKEDPERMIVSVTEHKEEELEPETVSEAPEILTEKAVEGTEGEAVPTETTPEKKSSDKTK